MKLTAKQTEAYKLVHSGEKQIILYGGAIRGGKTYWLLLTFVSLASKYPKSRWLIVRESLPTLKRTTLVTFQKLLDEGLNEHIAEFNKETYTVTFRNGSQLIFMSESYDTDKDLNRFKGLEINGGGLDEINEMQEQTFYKVIERSGSWQGAEGKPPNVVLASCNPSHNWVKEKFYDRHLDGTLPKKWAYIPARITDNPYIEPSYVQSLKDNMPPDEYKRFVDGDWNVIRVENPFITTLDESRHTGTQPFYDIKKQLNIWIDFNLNPFSGTFHHIWRDQDGDHHHQFNECAINNGSVPVMIDYIRDRYSPSLPNCIITGDAMGNRGDISQRDNASLYIQLIRGLGLRESQLHLAANPTHENSRADVNYYLYNHPDVKIHKEHCKGTIQDFKTVQCDAFGGIIKRNRNDLSQRADFLDTFRYGINNVQYKWINIHQKTHKYTKL
jgi:hypothetical protein